MARHTAIATIKAPIGVVFDLWTNLARMGEWVGGVTRVSDVSGPVARVGTRYTVWFGRMASPTEVLEADRPHLFATRFGNRLLRGTSRAVFEEVDGSTRLTQVFETVGRVSAISSWLFSRGSYAGSFQGELNHFARLAEEAAGAEEAPAASPPPPAPAA